MCFCTLLSSGDPVLTRFRSVSYLPEGSAQLSSNTGKGPSATPRPAAAPGAPELRPAACLPPGTEPVCRPLPASASAVWAPLASLSAWPGKSGASPFCPWQQGPASCGALHKDESSNLMAGVDPGVFVSSQMWPAPWVRAEQRGSERSPQAHGPHPQKPVLMAPTPPDSPSSRPIMCPHFPHSSVSLTVQLGASVLHTSPPGCLRGCALRHLTPLLQRECAC